MKRTGLISYSACLPPLAQWVSKSGKHYYYPEKWGEFEITDWARQYMPRCPICGSDVDGSDSAFKLNHFRMCSPTEEQKRNFLMRNI